MTANLRRHARTVTLAVSALLAAAPAAAQQRITLPAADTKLAGSLTPLFSIGTDEGEDWQLLSNVLQVSFDRTGNLYILDAGNFRVTQIDPRGRRVRSIGKKGGGPGELMSPTGITVTTDGSVAVADIGRNAFSIFAPNGTFKFNVPYPTDIGSPAIGMGGASPGILANPRGGLLVYGAMMMIARAPGDGPRTFPTHSPIYTLAVAEKSPAAQVLFQVPRTQPTTSTSGSGNQVSFRATMKEFAPGQFWGVLPDGGVAVQHGVGYGVDIIDAAGRHVRTLTRPLQARTATKRDQDAARSIREERLRSGSGAVRLSMGGPGGSQRSISVGGGGMDESEIKEVLRGIEFEPVVPVAQRMITTPRGRIWLQRTPTPYGGNGPIDVLDATGRYLGTLPPQALPDAISADGRAAYIERDEDGVEKVVVRQIPAAWL